MLLLCSCLFGIFISHSGASVSLMIKDGVSSFQDGSEVVLICTISPYNNLMTWLVNNDPYADCFKGSCGASSNKPFTFIFNFDENNGEFRLSIESVNTSHAGQLFSCDDGSERKTITFNVTTRDKDQNNTSITTTTVTTVGKSGPSDGLCSTYDGKCIGLMIGCIIAVLWLFGLIGFCYNCCCNANKSKKDNCISCIIWLLCIPILGVIVMIYMYLDCKRCSNETGQLQGSNETGQLQGSAQEFSAVNVEKTSIKVSWKRYDRNPSSANIYYLKISKNNPIRIADSEKTTTFSYTFSNLQDSTVYEIELNCLDIADQNNIFKRYKSLKVRTKGVPEAPSGFRVDRNDITESSIRVRWKPGDDGGSRQTFVLTCSTKDRNIEIEHNGENDMSYQWENLSERTSYDLELRAKNNEGLCTRIQPLKKRTLGKPDQPKNIRFEKNDITATSITVRWDPGSDEGCLQTFVLTISGEGISPTCDKIQHSSSKASWLKRWTQLSKGTDYDITIYAKNDVGESEPITRSIKTLATIPDPPTEFKEDDVTETSITVIWKPGHNGGCKQTFYVYINENEYEAKENGAYTFGSLTPNTYYNLALKAKNKEGEVSASPSLHIRTHGRPDTPKDLEIVDRTNSTITIQWEPGNDGGFSQNFILMDVQSGKPLTDPIQDTADHTMQHTITNLKDGTEFKLQVQASNEKGTSSSKTMKVKTR